MEYKKEYGVPPVETVDELLQAAKDEYLVKTEEIIEKYSEKRRRIMFRYLIQAGNKWQFAMMKIKWRRLIEKLNP